MKKLSFLLLLLLSGSFLFGQQTVVHDANAQVRNVGSFHQVEVSTGIKLILKQGSEEAVAVSAASDEIRDHIKTEVSNGKLKIYFDNKGMEGWHVKKEMKAYVSFKDIDALEANSGADVITDGNINADNLKVSLSSGAGFDGQVTAASLKVDQSSGSDMSIKGKVSSLDVSASSGSNFKGYDLASETCKADASSGSGIEITVNKELDAVASSGGDVHYKGDASVKNVSNSSGGRIKKES